MFQKKLVCTFSIRLIFEIHFLNISFISWLSVLLVKETGVPEENHQPAESHWQALSHKVHLIIIGIRTHNFRSDKP